LLTLATGVIVCLMLIGTGDGRRGAFEHRSYPGFGFWTIDKYPSLEVYLMVSRIKVGPSDFEHPMAHQRDRWEVPRRDRLYRRVFKRGIDVAFVVLALPIILPTILGLAAMIAIKGHSPFYRQDRLGRGGDVFTLWKLRTMVPDADTRLKEHLARDESARREWDAFQKLKSDPRITALGHVLRKTSLDELPQLWNVLKGDMSLVGPRPMMPDQRVLYPGSAYYLLRPGLTGFWQVSDRNMSTFAQRADFDADYERKLSLATDFKVLVATVGVVLRCTGQ
jgi:exopolysaccharide production protein ExoY